MGGLETPRILPGAAPWIGPGTIGLVILRDKVLKPLLAALANPLAPDPARPKQGRKPKTWSSIDEHYQTLRITMHALLADLHFAVT